MIRLAAACALAIALPATAMAGTAGPATTSARAKLSVRLADLTTGFCVDVLSRKVVSPPAAEESAWYERYGLEPGIPGEVGDALGVARGTDLIARATLASGEASDGAFVVALGGAAGETCRLLAYRTQDVTSLVSTLQLMERRERGWKILVAPGQSMVTGRFRLLKRHEDAPYLTSITQGPPQSPIAIAVVVAAVPPNVTIPEGF